jgi:hypothetical protein
MLTSSQLDELFGYGYSCAEIMAIEAEEEDAHAQAQAEAYDSCEDDAYDGGEDML